MTDRFKSVARIAIALLLLCFAYISIMSSLANVVARTSPLNANRLWSNDGRIEAALAKQALITGFPKLDQSQIREIATGSLIKDPTSVEAVDVLGLQYKFHGDDARAEAAFSYAVTLSSRDLQSQFWAIQKSVESGSISATLQHYDSAIRTSSVASEMLFPVLARATNDAIIRQKLSEILADAPWSEAFLVYLAQHAPKPVGAVAFFKQISDTGGTIAPDVQAALTKTLINQNLYGDAWSYYLTLNKNAVRDNSRNPRFIYDRKLRTPFDWTIPDSSQGYARFQPNTDDGGGLAFDLPSGTTAVIAMQVQALTPGNYELESSVQFQSKSDTHSLIWTIDCLNGAEIARFTQSTSSSEILSQTSEFSVDQKCKYQMLSLLVPASSGFDDTAGTVLSASLSRKRINVGPQVH